MLSHTSTFDFRSKAADWHFRFASSPLSIILTALLSFTYPVLAIPSIHRNARFVETDDQSSSLIQRDRPILPCPNRAQVCPRLESYVCLTLRRSLFGWLLQIPQVLLLWHKRLPSRLSNVLPSIMAHAVDTFINGRLSSPRLFD